MTDLTRIDPHDPETAGRRGRAVTHLGDQRHERASIARARRIVIKIGSSSLTAEDGHLDIAALNDLVDVISEHHAVGDQVLLVSSGAIAAAIGPLHLPGRPTDRAGAQAAASVGQGLLVARYTQAFARSNIRVGQVLLTVEDTVRRESYRNAQRALERLLALGVVPIINENDTVATAELKFGDNDRLAALVSHLVHADALVLLTDVDGLYTGPPSIPGNTRISEVLGPKDLEGIEVSGSGSKVGTGGMLTKLDSARLATASGTPVVLTRADQVRGALTGEDVGTFFAATGKHLSRKRLWFGFAAKPKGRLVLDDGAVRAVQGGVVSLLPVGVVAVEGTFREDDPVELVDRTGRVVARGLSGYDSTTIPALLGHSTEVLRAELGADYASPLVHRDDLVLMRRPTRRALEEEKKRRMNQSPAPGKGAPGAPAASGTGNGLPASTASPASTSSDLSSSDDLDTVEE